MVAVKSFQALALLAQVAMISAQPFEIPHDALIARDGGVSIDSPLHPHTRITPEVSRTDILRRPGAAKSSKRTKPAPQQPSRSPTATPATPPAPAVDLQRLADTLTSLETTETHHWCSTKRAKARSCWSIRSSRRVRARNGG